MCQSRVTCLPVDHGLLFQSASTIIIHLKHVQILYSKAILLIEIYIQYTIIQCISENTNTIMIITAKHDNTYAIQ